MFDQILKMATSGLTQQISSQENLPEGEAKDIAHTAGSSILNAISGQLSQGNTGGLMEMLSGQNTTSSNPLVNSMASGVVTNLMQKNGLSPQVAQSIANIAIPFIMNLFNDKVNNAKAGGLDVGGLISGVLSGAGGNNAGQSGGGGMLGSLLGGLFGGNKQAQPQQAQQGSSAQDLLGSVLGNFMK